MFLYNLTLQAPTAVSTAILGHFSGGKHQEVVVARQQFLELWRPDTATGKLVVEHSENLFCQVRSLAAFRLTGGSKDYIVLGSDAGALSLLEFDTRGKRFVAVQHHEFGRTGLRRQIPGQYVAADPRGRAVMVAGVERTKIVYVVTRDAAANVMIQSPLEANKAHSVCFDVVGVDVGYENPVFAAIETVGGDGAQTTKQLVYYELDLGLNHVVRKWSVGVSDTANKLIALPGSSDGPSGVLVCSEGFIEYRHSTGGAKVHRVPVPRRTGQIDTRGLMIVASAVHRMKNAFFILAQAETGDLYKIAVQYTADEVTRIGIKYFDTIAPTSSLCILRAGFLFATTMESGSGHQLFQFENLGDEGGECFSTDSEHGSVPEFSAHELSSLALVDEIESLSPVIRSQVHNLADEEAPQIYALCGRGGRSALRIVRHGLEVSEMAVSELPGTPRAVWTVRRRESDSCDEYIVVSFVDATLVLSVGEEVEEVKDSGLLATAPTLALHRVDGGGLVQVTPRAVRHVMADGRVSEWQPPQGREIACAAVNARQVVVALARSGGHAIYFELHDQLGVLREHEQALHVGSDITSLALAPVDAGRVGAAFVAVGCEDRTVRVFALDAARCLEPLSVQAVADSPHSVAMVQQGVLTLYAGLRNGLLVRANVDAVSGELSAPRTRFLGARPVQLCVATVRGTPAVVALATAPWLCHVVQGRVRVTPLSYDALDYAAGFTSDQCAEGLVCIASNTLRILSIDRPDAIFNHAAIPLSLTPRDFVLNATSRHFAVIETEHAHLTSAQAARELVARGDVSESEAETAVLPPEQFGLVRSERGRWASLIRVLDPFTGDSTQIIELEDNFAAVSLAEVVFGGETFVVVGCARGMTLSPRGCQAGSIRTYRWAEEGTRLELVHATPVDDIPQCLLPFNGLLLVSLGGTLRLYDMGIRQLLKKTQSSVSPHVITMMRPHPQLPNQRLFIADVQESIRLVAYSPDTHVFRTVVDDTLPRYITSMHVLDDGDTVVAGDKFGNLAVLRVPERAAKLLDSDPTGARLAFEKPKFGTTHKWDLVAEFHIGDIATSLTTCALAPASRQVILYTTLMGSLQVCVPFVSKSDMDFFRTLELAMRKLWTPASGRNHLAYRSAISPVRSFVDGDLCEVFFTLDYDMREAISDEVDRTQSDIFKKLEDMRSMFAF
ncbi:pre-mRNA-splicing factor rse1 [Coemansia sp. RSA 678]|nr:pre-mRNA-splicing factor rse1 [Coemansia sp. RSA 678]